MWLALKGSSEQKETEKRVISGKAWEDYCDTLKAAGTAILAPGAPTTPFDQAEGYRYLTRLVRGSLKAFLECKDYDKPKFSAIANGYTQAPVKIGSDNPDNLYESALVSSRFAYEMIIQKNTVDYLGFSTQSGTYGSAGGLKMIDSKESKEFELSRDGKIRILVAPVNYDKRVNFMRLEKSVEEALIIVRQTFKDRRKEVAALLEIRKVAEFDYNEKEDTLGEVKFVTDVASNETIDKNDAFSEKKQTHL